MKRHSLLWHCQLLWPHHHQLPHKSEKVEGEKEGKIRGKIGVGDIVVCVDHMLEKITVKPPLMTTSLQGRLTNGVYKNTLIYLSQNVFLILLHVVINRSFMTKCQVHL